MTRKIRDSSPASLFPGEELHRAAVTALPIPELTADLRAPGPDHTLTPRVPLLSLLPGAVRAPCAEYRVGCTALGSC